MRYPFWILNGALVGLLLLGLLFLGVSQQRSPRIAPIHPEETRATLKQVSKIDLGKIYNNDLFSTYREATASNTERATERPLIPQPPQPRPIRVPIATPARFLEPLPITLRGIIVTSDENKNVALVEDNRTKETKNYKAGSKISDGYVLRIAKNKLVILRSNGQQESLYVDAEDPDLKEVLASSRNWSSMIQKQSDSSYTVNICEFIEYVPTLAQLIEVFNLTTAYKKGKSVGCKIGTIDQNSIAQAMGLISGDVITHINELPIATTQERLKAYETVIQLQPGSSIEVTLLRNRQTKKIRYNLQEAQADTKKEGKAEQITELGKQKSDEEIQNEKNRILREKYKFAPTIQELKREQSKRVSLNGSRTNRSLFESLEKQ